MQWYRRIGAWVISLVVVGLLVWQAVPVRGQETISAQFRIQLNVLNRLLVGLRTVTSTLDQDYTQLFASGTGANQANALYQAQRTLGASAAETLDLNASLTDDFGQSVTCTKLKALVVKAAAANTNNVLVGGGATTITTVWTATNDQIIVRPGGIFMLTAPDATGAALTAGASDLLAVTNSAGSTSVTYDVIVVCAE